MKNRTERIELEMEPVEARVIGDVNQLRFLLENLIDEALTVREDGVLFVCRFAGMMSIFVFSLRIRDVRRV